MAADCGRRGFKIFSGDGAPSMLGWNLQRGWYHKDSPAIAPMTLSRKRFYSMGALSDGILRCRFYDKANTENLADFPTGAYGEYGPFVIFLDNASCHKSGELKLSLERTGGKITARCFPPCTPGLNPAESQRGSFKATGNRPYDSTEETRQPVRKMLGNEIPIVKAFEYLTCWTQCGPERSQPLGHPVLALSKRRGLLRPASIADPVGKMGAAITVNPRIFRAPLHAMCAYFCANWHRAPLALQGYSAF